MVGKFLEMNDDDINVVGHDDNLGRNLVIHGRWHFSYVL